MAKPSKQFKKFASSGKLKETIQKRRSTQQARRKYEDRIAQRKKQRGAPKDEGFGDEGDDSDEDDRSDRALGVGGRAGGVGKEVDDLLKDDLRLAGPESEGDEDDDSEGDDEDGEDEEGDELDEDDEESDGEDEEDLEKSEEAMKKAMKQLEKNDPEFFKYLQQNDKDLLEFGDASNASDGDDEEMDGAEGDAEEEDGEDEEEADVDMDDEKEEERAKTPVTRKMLREWQEGMLKVSITMTSVHILSGCHDGPYQHAVSFLPLGGLD
jgi:nucleolar complex protein 2